MQKIKVDGTWNEERFKEIGRGGEAVVYKLKKDLVAKIYLQPNATEFKGDRVLQQAAQARLLDVQSKLVELPGNLPDNLCAPTALLVDANLKVIGYAMSFIEGTLLEKMCRPSFRWRGKYPRRELILAMYDTLAAVHSKNIVFGDLNENNIIVENISWRPYFLDIDAIQFGKYLCKSFMLQFTAPELILPGNGRTGQLVLNKPFSRESDWYAFLVIVMRLLTYTHPYGGTLNGFDLSARIARGITIFDRRVAYPVNCRSVRSLPRPIIEVFLKQFQAGERFVPERKVFEALQE